MTEAVVKVVNWIWFHEWSWLPLWYLILSTMTFLVYAVDKHAAVHGHWRTSEATLHFLELLGGWPGALLGQRWLHHKCSKVSYQNAFLCLIPLNVIGAVYIVYGQITDDWSLNRLTALFK